MNEPPPSSVDLSSEHTTEVDPYGGRFGAIRSLRRHAARGTIVNGIYQISLAGLSAIRGFGAAIFLTASQYGVWGFLGLAMWTVVGLKDVGVNQKYIQQSESDQELAFQRGFTVELIFSAISMPAIAAVVCLLALLIGDPSLIAPGLVLTLIVPGAALKFPIWAYYRRMDFRRQRILQGVDPLVATVLTIALAAAGLGYWSLVVGAVAGAWAGAAAAIHWRPHPLAIQYDRGTLRQYVKFSGPLLFTGLAALATFYVIYIVGETAVGLAGLGAFTLAGNLIQFTDKADIVITETMYPALCAVQDRLDTLREAFVKSNRLALMWAAPFGIGMSLFASDLVQYVLGEKWAPAIGILQVTGVVTTVHHVGFNWAAFFRARADTRPIAVVGLASAAAVITVAPPLMFAIGVVGMAWAFAAGEAVAFVLRMRYMTRLFSGFRPLRHLVRALWPTAIAAGLVVGLRGLDVGDGGVAVLVELGVFLGTMAVATWAFERSLLREAVGYFISKGRLGTPSGASAPAGG